MQSIIVITLLREWGLFSLNDFKNFLKGMVLGISNIIPGVSAGTMAVVLGIYNKIIESVSSILRSFSKNFRFLLFLGLGVIGGILFFSNLIEGFLEKYPWQMSYLFMGLIGGSIGILIKTTISHKPKKIHYIYFVVTLLALIIMKFTNPVDSTSIIESLDFKSGIKLFVSGFVASSAMILPGVSGSFVLVLFGMYNTIISAISNFNIIILIPFGIGVLLGLITMVKVVEYLLRKYTAQTYMGIMGLVIGSIFSIIPGFEISMREVSCIIVFIVGYLISYYICKLNPEN